VRRDGGEKLEAPRGLAMAERVAFATDWLFFPDWLTLEQACYLSGWGEATTQGSSTRTAWI
jgi:hypothetical protein